jgi:hypothetical protein
MFSRRVSSGMGTKKRVVDLSAEDRRTLEWFISTGKRKAEDNTRARILLKADDGLTDSGAFTPRTISALSRNWHLTGSVDRCSRRRETL